MSLTSQGHLDATLYSRVSITRASMTIMICTSICNEEASADVSAPTAKPTNGKLRRQLQRPAADDDDRDQYVKRYGEIADQVARHITVWQGRVRQTRKSVLRESGNV